MQKVNNNSILRECFNVGFFVSLFLCFVWPLGGLMVALCTVLNKNQANERRLIYLIVSLSFFLAYINTTKTASSDTIHYLNWYNDIDRSNPLYSFLFYRGTYSIAEPLFAIISIAINYLTSGSKTGYIFFCTFIMYFLQLYAIYIVAKKYEVEKKYIVCLLLMLAFINPLFIQSVHALRQMLATAFLMLAIANRVVYGKNSVGILIAAFLTHVSVMVYLPLVILSMCYKELTIRRVLSVVALVFLMIMASNNIGILMGGMGSEILSAAGEKIVQSSDHNQMELNLRGFYIYNIPFLLVTILSLCSNRGQYPSLSVYYYVYVITFLIVVLNPISTEVSIRYAFFVFAFFQYSFLAYYTTNRTKASVILPVTTGLLVLIFFWLLAGDRTYAGISTILFKLFPFML